jgi:hypothetical protein
VRVREPLRQRKQPLGARAREAVDRLVVVTDDAYVVTLAEPEVEQRLLETLTSWYSSTVNARQRSRTSARASRSSSSSWIARSRRSSKSIAPAAALRSRTPGRHGARGRPAAAARGRRDRRCVCGSAGGSSPTRPPSRGRPPAEAVRLRQGVADLAQQETFVERIRPGSPANRRSSAGAAEWNVDARALDSESGEPRAAPGRLVGERDGDELRGADLPLATCHAIRLVIVVVFPVPAPARMQTGPRVASTAARCSSFRPSKIRSAFKANHRIRTVGRLSSREGAKSG